MANLQRTSLGADSLAILHDADLDPPRELTPAALRYFRELISPKPISEWGEPDLSAVCDLAECHVDLVEEKTALSAEGNIINGPSGPKRNPRAGVVVEIRRQILQLSRFCRIDPQSNSTKARQLRRGFDSAVFAVGDNDGLIP